MNSQAIFKKIERILRQSGTTNLLEVAASLNIKVIDTYDLGKLYGFYAYMKKRKVIFMNSNLSDLHYNIVLAHEIGHALLHSKVNCAFIKNKTYMKYCTYEKEANYFAVHFLKATGYLTDENFCIHMTDLTDQDKLFVEALADLL